MSRACGIAGFIEGLVGMMCHVVCKIAVVWPLIVCAYVREEQSKSQTTQNSCGACVAPLLVWWCLQVRCLLKDCASPLEWYRHDSHLRQCALCALDQS